MAVYTVHEPPSRKGAAAPERFVFVRDGFSLAALLFGPLWMLRHRMWLVLLAYAAVVAVLTLVLHLQGSAGVAVTVFVLLGLLIGFEAGTLRRFTLGRRGFRNIGIVVGDDLELAERRFFDNWTRNSSTRAAAPATRTEPRAPAPAATRSAPAASDVLGLFPEPGAPPGTPS
ncbi:MAG TPA: DUF2628 domain-containing protein [Xanthobacteraceae bacterium]|jgi:hypothetical protein